MVYNNIYVQWCTALQNRNFYLFRVLIKYYQVLNGQSHQFQVKSHDVYAVTSSWWFHFFFLYQELNIIRLKISCPGQDRVEYVVGFKG